jgi:hypothetical protein
VRIAPEASQADGVEALIKNDSSRALSWWVSVIRSRAVDRFGSHEVPRSWDQPSSASFSVNYHRGSAWNFNVSGQIHTGWPTTGVTAFFTDPARTNVGARLGERNEERYATYRRFDFRAMRSVPTRHGTFSSWVDVMNVLNHVNDCCGDSLDFNGNRATGVITVTKRSTGIGWLPSFGVAWEF